jgi:hypothetical protein
VTLLAASNRGAFPDGRRRPVRRHSGAASREWASESHRTRITTLYRVPIFPHRLSWGTNIDDDDDDDDDEEEEEEGSAWRIMPDPRPWMDGPRETARRGWWNSHPRRGVADGTTRRPCWGGGGDDDD